MAITYDDVKLMQSQLLDDSDDGGGYMTGNEVIDGNVNNLFPDKSRLDMVYGRVSLRKAFLAILSDTVDTYYGSHVILTQQAVDPRVSVCMFSTDSMSDVRTAAQTYIENYVVPSILFVGQLIGTHLEGSMSISLAQRTDRTAPVAGDVLQLVESGNSQYVKLMAVSSETQSFWDPNTQTSFDMNVLTCDTGTALSYTFHGPEVTRSASQGSVPVYTTKVADTSKYYSISPLIEALEVGDSVITAESIWTHLVPSAQSESVLSDRRPTEETLSVIPDGTATITINLGNVTIGDGGSLYLAHGVQRGSLGLTIGGIVYHDDETGNVLDVGEATVGTINYFSGEIIFASSKSGSASVSYKPAGAPTVLQNSDEIEITLANRALNYVRTLLVTINPGTLVIDYMAQGRWYTLRDNGETDISGKGFLLPDITGTGSGTIQRTTNTVTVTLGALPDVGSKILYRWGEDFQYVSRAGTLNAGMPEVSYTVLNGKVDPGTLTITWGTPTKTVTDDGNGNLIGDGDGTVVYGTGLIKLKPTNTYSSSETFTYAYTVTTFSSQAKSQTVLPWSFSLPNNIDPDSVSFLMRVEEDAYAAGPVDVRVKDDGIDHGGGVGWLVYDGDQSINGGVHTSSFTYSNGKFTFTDGVQVGTITYATGACEVTTVPGFVAWSSYTYQYGSVPCSGLGACSTSLRRGVTTHTNEAVQAECVVGYSSTVNYSVVGAGSNPYTDEEYTPTALVFRLLNDPDSYIVPGSVLFTFDDLYYQDNGEGNLYHTMDPETGVGTLAGSINYTSGDATLTAWGVGGNLWAIVIKGMLCSASSQGIPMFTFRTAGCPLRPSSFQITCNLADGTAVNATSDAGGNISATQIEGYIDNVTGVAWVIFGEWVLVADAETEDWYNPNSRNAAGTHTWKPNYAIPETVKYNCVVYKYTPLDPTLLGLDPTRLPSDGRVPAFRTGYIIVIHNTLYETCPVPLSAGQVITLPRNPVSLIELYDQDDLYVSKNYYTEDLDAGTITMADPLDLSPFVEPLVALHRIEDMGLVSDVQINGVLTIAAPITYAYPANTSYVSGVLPFGDKKARYHHLFDQYVWTGEWSDTLIGNPCIANYNDIDFPFELTNKGATTERWMLQFDSTTHFVVIGETLGQIDDGYTTNDCHPTNPATGVDYFMIRLGGWGSGWVSGNVLRFNTDGARAPIWFCRTTLQGPSTEPEDKFCCQLRGDAD